MPDEDIRAFLRSGLETNESNQAMAAIQAPGTAEPAIRGRVAATTFEERNRQGLPIDITSGVAPSVRLGVALRDTPEDQMTYLSETYGAGAARRADTGEWLVKVPDPQSTIGWKEVLVNERGLTAKDALSLVGYAPETLGVAAAMKGGRLLPKIGKAEGIGGFFRDVFAQAIGQEAGGAAKDIGVRLYDRTPIDIGEIAERRLSNVPFDAVIGTGLGFAGKVASKVITPIGPSANVVDVEARDAAARLATRHGQEITTSIGEATGSPVFKRIEATAAQLPGSSKYFRGLLEEKTAQLRNLVDKITGGAVGEAETLGEESVTHIKSKLTPVQEAIERNRNAVLAEGSQKVMNDLQSTIPGQQMAPETIGSEIRQEAFRLRGAFTAESKNRYDAFLGMEGGRDRLFESPALSKRAKQLLAELPPKTETASEVAYDAYGSPIERVTSKTAPSKEFVPEKVVGKLQELANTPKEKRSLQDLISIRGEIDDDIAEGQAIRNRQTRYLTKARGMVTDAIDEAIESVEDVGQRDALKAAQKHAEDFYKANAPKFQNKHIARLFREIEQGGFVNDEDIVQNIGPEEYNTFKEFLGPKSQQFQNLQQGIRDSIFNSSLASIGPDSALIDGAKLGRNLSKYYEKNRTVAEEVFGTKLKGMQFAGDVMRAAEEFGQKAGTGAAKLDKAKLDAAIKSGEPFASAVERLVKEQVKLDDLYRSQILKDIGEGNVGKNFNAQEFVDRFYDAASKKEVESVMVQLADNPELVEGLRRKMIQKVLFQAQRGAKASDPLSLGPGDPLLPPNANSLKQAVGDVDRRGNLRTILGRETYEDILDLAKVVRGADVNEAAFRAAGGMAAGSQISAMFRGGILNYATDYTKQLFAAIVLSNPITRAWAKNGLMKAPLTIAGKEIAKTKEGALITTLIGSTPFLEAVSDELGQGAAAESFLTNLKRSVNMWEGRKTEQKPQDTSEEDRIRQDLKRTFEVPKP